MLTYNKEYQAYSIGQHFETPNEFSMVDLEEDGCARFVGSVGPMTYDASDIHDLESYKELLKNQLEVATEKLEALTWIFKTFTDVSCQGDFYPREGDYSTYIDIPTDQFLEYCKKHNLPLPIPE